MKPNSDYQQALATILKAQKESVAADNQLRREVALNDNELPWRKHWSELFKGNDVDMTRKNRLMFKQVKTDDEMIEVDFIYAVLGKPRIIKQHLVRRDRDTQHYYPRLCKASLGKHCEWCKFKGSLTSTDAKILIPVKVIDAYVYGGTDHYTHKVLKQPAFWMCLPSNKEITKGLTTGFFKMRMKSIIHAKYKTQVHFKIVKDNVSIEPFKQNLPKYQNTLKYVDLPKRINFKDHMVWTTQEEDLEDIAFLKSNGGVQFYNFVTKKGKTIVQESKPKKKSTSLKEFEKQEAERERKLKKLRQKRNQK